MTKTTVIFALTANEARWALAYKNNHPKEIVKILSPEISAQLELQKKGFPYDDYFVHYYDQKDYYRKSIQRYEEESRTITLKVLETLKKQLPQYTDIYYPLQNRLELILFERLHAYDFCKRIILGWKPSSYYISSRYRNSQKKSYSYYDPSQSQMAVIAYNFIAKSKLKTFDVQESTYKIPNLIHTIFQKAGHPKTWKNKLLSLIPQRHTSHPVDILFFATGGRNISYYHHTLDYLTKNSISYIVVFQTLVLQEEEMVRRYNIPFIRLDTLYNRIDREILTKQIAILKKDTAKVFDTFIPSQLFNFKLDDNLKKSFFSGTSDIISNYIGKNLKQTYLSATVLDLYKPKILITTHDPGPSAMPFIFESKKRNIQTLVFMHGWQDTILGVDHKSDHIAVWGPYTSAWYQDRLKKKAETIHPLGYPGFDDIFLNKKAFWQKPTTKSSLPTPINLSLLLTMYIPNTATLSIFLHEFFKVFAPKKDQYNVFIRTHPGQRIEGITQLAKWYGIGVRVNPPCGLEEYISSSDVILSWDTTALLWAMIYGKPLFYCAPNWYWGITPIKELGGAWLAKSAQDLFVQIDNLKQNPHHLTQLHKQQLHFLKNVVGVLDGTSSQKHFQLIKQLLFDKNHR